MTRTGIGYDSHRFAPGRRLILGGIEIPHERGLAGHSDADALCHALCDALLGAVAAGDIGQHFPDNDPRWRDCDSTLLLAECAAKVRTGGWRIVNTDATIILERPKLRPHIEAMRLRLAEVMGIAPEAVSLKGKTNEGMDACGRGEGLAVMAIATVTRSGS